MNELNRSLIVIFCGVIIMLAAVVIFLTWSANTEVIDGLFDAVDYLERNNDDVGRLIVTLVALMVGVAALLGIILELAPEDEEKELKVQQAGSTTIVPAQALRERLEEALLMLPDVTSARARVKTRDQGIAVQLDVTLTPSANVAHVTQESSRVAVDTIQQDLGLPVHGAPVVRVAFGGEKPEPVASSVSQEPAASQAPAPPQESPPSDHAQFQRPSPTPDSPYSPERPSGAGGPPQPEDAPPGDGEPGDRPQS